MNKQLIKIDETIEWLEANASENACVVLMAMADTDIEDGTVAAESLLKSVELKTLIEGYDEDLYLMLVKKMVDVPLLKQVFTEALAHLDIKLEIEEFTKWRDKNKYDNPYKPFVVSEADNEPVEGEPEEYILKVQEFCTWMSEKPSRNLTVLLLAMDDLNSAHTTFAMGYAPDMAIMVSKEIQDNYGFRTMMEYALYTIELEASYDEILDWKEYNKKK